jgi:hypothetical protein
MEYGLYNDDPVIRTFSGTWFNAFEPTPEMINIEDIAHALSHQCRFGGHLPRFFSVAQHSVMATFMVQDEDRLAALLHDASEAYLVDIPRPIKNKLSNYKEIEDRVMNVISRKYGFAWPLVEDVKKADEAMLHKEWYDIMLSGNPHFECLNQGDSKQQFLKQFYNLTHGQATIL